MQLPFIVGIIISVNWVKDKKMQMPEEKEKNNNEWYTKHYADN